MTNDNTRKNNNIVKTIVKNIINCLIIMIVVVVMFGTISCIEHHYTVEMTVVSVNEDGTVELKNKNDEIWEFYGDGYKKGQTVKVRMYDNTTSSIFDDVIEDVKIIK